VLVNSGSYEVTLDLTECSFFGSDGLQVIATAASRLKLAGGSLTISSPSAILRRIPAIAWLTELARENSPSATVTADPAVVEGTAGEDLGISYHLREIGSMPASDDVVDGALHLVTTLAQTTIGGADGVSVSLRRHGALATVAATDAIISQMDASQYGTGQGPCVDAASKGLWFHAESLDSETRWPAFIPRARALGITAILSSPLLTRDVPVGALNIYSRTVAAFTPKDQELASVFAHEASVILGAARVDANHVELAERLQKALRAREVIAQAKGVLMEREAVSEHTAARMLRSFSIQANRPLIERAEDIVSSTQYQMKSSNSDTPRDKNV